MTTYAHVWDMQFFKGCKFENQIVLYIYGVKKISILILYNTVHIFQAFLMFKTFLGVFFACPLQLPRNSLKFIFWFVTSILRPRWRRWPWDSGIVYSSMDMCTYNIGNASASVLFPDLEKRDQHSSISCPLLPLPFCHPLPQRTPFRLSNRRESVRRGLKASKTEITSEPPVVKSKLCVHRLVKLHYSSVCQTAQFRALAGFEPRL